MLTDDEVRKRLIETAQAVAESPPSTEEVLLAGRRQRWRIRWAVAALVASGALLFVAVSYAGFYGRAAVRPFDVPLVTEPTLVPDVVYASLGAARDRLEDAGLKAEPAASCQQGDACRVEEQRPRPGVRVEKGTAVELRLAPPGPHLVAVPAVEDLPANAAVARLTAAGLRARPEGPCRVGAQECFVADQTPDAGTRRPEGARVVLALELRGGSVTVPAVVGLDRDTAVTAVRDAGLEVELDEQCWEPTLPCRVADQSPVGDSEVQRGTTIRLVLRGGQLVTVPDVVGLPEAEARDALAARGLAALGAPCAAAAGCKVASQRPAGGQEVVPETRVALELEELAIEPDTTEVPRVVGLPVGDAVAAIEGARLEAVLRPRCPQGATCQVAGQSIAAGATVEVRTTVVLSLRVLEEPAPGEP